jgi:hypothetical protein
MRDGIDPAHLIGLIQDDDDDDDEYGRNMFNYKNLYGMHSMHAFIAPNFDLQLTFSKLQV